MRWRDFIAGAGTVVLADAGRRSAGFETFDCELSRRTNRNDLSAARQHA